MPPDGKPNHCSLWCSSPVRFKPFNLFVSAIILIESPLLRLMSTEQLNPLIGYYNDPYQQQQLPGNLDPSYRMQMYNGYVADLSMVLPPLQSSDSGGRSDPIAQYGQWSTHRKQERTERRAAKASAKGRDKKATKLENALLWLVVVNASQAAATDYSANAPEDHYDSRPQKY